MPLDLYFPQLGGGVEQGLNDAGIETFEGDFQQHIMRECTQNALDARSSPDVPVRLEIHLRQIPAAEIPGLGSIRTAIQSAKAYWQGNEKTERYCAKALTWTGDNEVSVLEVADYGTKGLSGADDDHRGAWFGLVRSGGVSINQDDAGGAFGIGKKAPFAGSFARTVYYSTLNQSGGQAFQGAITLTTHLDPNGQKTQGSGFIGDVVAGSSECSSVRDPGRIPTAFRRTKVGTSLFILAYRDVSGIDWTDGFVRHAIENFWPAIHRGILEFQIGDTRVDTTTLSSLMDRLATEGSFHSRLYYRAVRSESCQEWTTTLPHLGACQLHLVPGDATYPKKICMTRQTGMLIYRASRFRSYRPFAGLFTCNSHEGNSYLRKLEPPRHDRWDPSRADNQSQARGVLKSIREWINQCLRELNPDEDACEADIPELNRYLPDDEDEDLDGEATASSGGNGGEGIVAAPVTQVLPIVQVPLRPLSRQQPGPVSTPADGNEDGDGSGGGRPSQGESPTNTPEGQGETSGGGATGLHQPREVKTQLALRSLRSGPCEYDLIVRSEVPCAGDLRLVSVGEDNKEDADLQISKIQDIDSGTVITDNRIEVPHDRPVRLRVTVNSTVALSLRAYCHGN